MSDALANMTPEDRLMVFYEPCKSKEELKWHMKAFLKVDLPDQIIDEDSTSTPVEFIWSVYHGMMTGTGPTRHVVAAARNGAKTLAAVLVRFYGMVHFRRDGTHLAANLEQSKSATRYLNKFLSLADVAPYVKLNNTRNIELHGLPANSYTKRSTAILQVAVATLGGVNSQRGSLNTRDELDLVPATILAEASFQNDPTQDEHMFNAIEINLSSRKSNSGPIQSLLDEDERGTSPNLKVHKWSTVDWMKRCTEDVHKPDQPVKAWINQESLKVTWGQENYDVMTQAEQALQKEVKAFAGCVTCPAFVACQGRAPQQRGTQRMLRTREFVGDVLTSVKDPDKIAAQALNWKPESSAVIFRIFNRRRHLLDGIQAWVWLFGEFYNPMGFDDAAIKQILKEGKPYLLAQLTPTKQQIYDELIRRGWKIHYGVDWGYNPDPAVCIVVAYHKKQKRAFVLHVEEALNHSNEDWAEHIKLNIYPIYPAELVAPDLADKASPTYFRKRGMTCLDKKPARIETGVSQLRGLLWNVAEQREMMVFLDDGEMGKMRWVAECFEKWTWLKTAMGYQYGKFDGDSEWTHPIDALRYALHPFIDVQDARISATQPKSENQTVKEAAEGNIDAIKAMQDHTLTETGRRALERHFAQEFGLANVFASEDRMKKEAAEKENLTSAEKAKPKQSGLKFKF